MSKNQHQFNQGKKNQANYQTSKKTLNIYKEHLFLIWLVWLDRLPHDAVVSKMVQVRLIQSESDEEAGRDNPKFWHPVDDIEDYDMSRVSFFFSHIKIVKIFIYLEIQETTSWRTNHHL